MRLYDHLRLTGAIDGPVEPKSDLSYHLVAVYRAELDSIVERAVRHYTGLLFTIDHARLYVIELRTVPVPAIRDYSPERDLAERYEVLKSLINIKP